MLRTTFPTVVTTPIPPELSPEDVIEGLHDHKLIITMQPLTTRSSRKGDDQYGQGWDVWENIDLLPFGLWKHEIHFETWFQDTEDGMKTHLNAPLGLVSDAVYRVRPSNPDGPSEDDQPPTSPQDAERGPSTNAWARGWVLEEKVESSVSIFFKALVEGNMIPARQGLHKRLMENLMQRKKVADVPELPGSPN